MAYLQADCKFFFSSLSKAYHVSGAERGAEDFEVDDDDPTIPTCQDKNFNTLQLFVETQIEVDDPIVFQQHNLCQLAKEGRMGELQVDALKKAYQELEVAVTGSKRKKETFVSPSRSTSLPVVQRVANTVAVLHISLFFRDFKETFPQETWAYFGVVTYKLKCSRSKSYVSKA